MFLNYDVTLPVEDKVQSGEDVIKEDDKRRNLMTRASMNATALSAMQNPTGGAGTVNQPMNKQGWGQV